MIKKDSKGNEKKSGRAHMVDMEIILKAAAYLFDKKGYQETTMQDIADWLGISKPTLYRYAKSKSDLLQLVIEQWIDLSTHTMEYVINLPDRKERLSVLVQMWAKLAATKGAHLKVFLSDENDMPSQVIRKHKAWTKNMYASVKQLILDGQAEGYFRKEADPTIVAFSIIGFILLMPRWLKNDGRLKPEDVGKEFTETLIKGLQISA